MPHPPRCLWIGHGGDYQRSPAVQALVQGLEKEELQRMTLRVLEHNLNLTIRLAAGG